MNLLMRLTIRNLLLNKKRTIVTIIGIILSGAMICGVYALVASFQDYFVESAKVTDGNYHAAFYNVPYQNKGIVLNNVQIGEGMLSRNEGIAKPLIDKEPEKPYILVKAYDDTAFENMPVRLKAGRFPMKAGEILIVEQLTSEKNQGWEIGQEITLPIGNRVDNGEILGTNSELSGTEVFEELRRETYTITGIMERPRFESHSNPAFTAIAYLDESLLSEADAVNISVLLENPRKIYQVVPQISEAAGSIEYSYNNELLKWMGISKNENYNNTMINLELIIISLIVIGSVTVIYNAFAISVSERKKQFGMLASVGASRKQIRKTVYFEGLIIGVLGIPLGILSGILGIGVTINVINPLLDSFLFDYGVSLRLVVSPMVIAAAVLFTAIIIMLSAFLPAIKASRISPIDAIRLAADIRIKGKKLKTSRLTRWIFGFEGELALKNLKRNRRKYAATVLSLFISIVLFVSFSSFITYGLSSSNMYYNKLSYDINVYKYNDSQQEVKEFFDEVSKLEGVREYSIPRSVSANLIESDREHSRFRAYIDQYTEGTELDEYHVSFAVYTLNKAAYDQYLKEIGMDPPDFGSTDEIEAILINKDMTNFTGKYVEYTPADVSAGEVLHLKEYQYGDDHTPAGFDVKIAKITDKLPFGLNYNYRINLVIQEEDFEAIRLIMKEENRQEGDYRNIYIASDTPDSLAEAIRELHDKHFSSDVSINNISARQENMQKSNLVVSIFLYGFVILITLIGVTNIFNTISTNVALRRREFAVLKSVGLTPAGFNRMLRYESIFYGLKALLYGLPFSIAISLLMYRSFGYSFEFEFMLPWNSILICIIGVFLIIFITMIHSVRKMKHDNIADTLKLENL